MVIVINSATDGFSWKDKVSLAALWVRLQVSDCNQLSDYNCIEWWMKNKAVNAPITFEEIVMIKIKPQKGPWALIVTGS